MCDQETFRSGRGEGYLNGECLERQQAARKSSRRFRQVPTPTALCGAPATSPLIPMMAFEQSPLNQPVSMQDHDQTSSRGIVRLNLITTIGQRRIYENPMLLWGQNSGAFHAGVVVLNHFPGSVSNPNRTLAGISDLNFRSAGQSSSLQTWF